MLRSTPQKGQREKKYIIVIVLGVPSLSILLSSVHELWNLGNVGKLEHIICAGRMILA
jgi:hypothetical protein